MLHDGRWLGRRASRSFTLQWHLTNACELRCKHCYDRTKIAALSLEQALGVLEGMVAFCRARGVSGKLSLTGGNPFLYPKFMELYRAAAETNLGINILGNPVSREALAELAALRRPSYFQVSLEGLEAHNDQVRGAGHFQRVLEFLPWLREQGIRANVMLTLTKANLDQVIPLGERLIGLADRFTFNRLSQTGEGANLEVPETEAYVEFMKRYLEATRNNPILAVKDNLFNIVRQHFGRESFGGCTGYGCGAALNFFALLPDGEVHACRKFPSPLGNLLELGFAGVYDSSEAKRYRIGCSQCRFCPLRANCGGCLAVTEGRGLDPFKDRDPDCFHREQRKLLSEW